MIGDWIIHRIHLNGMNNPPFKRNIQIKNIYGNDVNCNTEDNTIVSGTFLDTCYPIQLTDSILRINGIEEEDGVYLLDFDNPLPFALKKWLDCFMFGASYIDGFKSFMIKIKYVHQLQQALRVCGLSNLADNFKI